MLNLLTIEQIGLLRKTAANSIYEYPFRPLMLELALVGLSRWSIAHLNIFSFSEYDKRMIGEKIVETRNCVTWNIKNQVVRNTRLSDMQWSIAQDYLHWRRFAIYAETNTLFVTNEERRGKPEDFWEPMTPERVRYEIKCLGRDCYISPKLEISHLHKSMANIMRFQGIPEERIFEIYGKKRYRDKT